MGSVEGGALRRLAPLLSLVFVFSDCQGIELEADEPRAALTSAPAPVPSGGTEPSHRLEGSHGEGTLIVYNDIVKGGDRALSWEARERYEQGLRAALKSALGEDLDGATMKRAPFLDELERLVKLAPGDRVVYYGHMVGPIEARRISPTGQLEYSVTGRRFATWLPENVESVEVIGCRSESFARSVSAELPGLTIRTMSSTMNLLDWVNPDDPGDVRVWQSVIDDGPTPPPRVTTQMMLTRLPEP
jgi:hypothetical protein